MKYKEEFGDLFDLNNSWPKAHCISVDAMMGAGIAVQFDKRNQDMRAYILQDIEFHHKHVGSIVRYCHPSTKEITYNLLTKAKYWEKPTYESFTKTIANLREAMLSFNETKIAMPLLGAGIDQLSWTKNQKIIKDVFKDTDIEIRVVRLP